MQLVGATANPLKFKELITGEVKNKKMEIGTSNGLSLPISEINNRLTYGYIEIVRDGEVQ